MGNRELFCPTLLVVDNQGDGTEVEMILLVLVENQFKLTLYTQLNLLWVFL